MNLKFTAILLSFCSLTLGSFAQSSRRSTKVHTNALEDSLTTIGQRYTLALDSLNKFELETSAPMIQTILKILIISPCLHPAPSIIFQCNWNWARCNLVRPLCKVALRRR